MHSVSSPAVSPGLDTGSIRLPDSTAANLGSLSRFCPARLHDVRIHIYHLLNIAVLIKVITMTVCKTRLFNI
ncbi:hypothetical protein ATANTOWER_026802 [Ataeniobius toweri]|uniref:Uncharacterized protein n=1 Tax=Ataeniobius toweri TaxID=208326 RepID=A0ABU7CDI7_9TELE|nr:hypothetical protein [Ataeniobius toweri]